MAGFEHVEVDECGIMHDIRVILACEHKSGSAHISRELINFVEFAVNHGPARRRISQITDHEVVRGSFSKLRKLKIDTSHPTALPL